MKLVDMPRAAGKTYQLVCKSLETYIPIAVHDEAAKQICYKIILKETNSQKDLIVYTYEEYSKLEEKPKKIYIDDGLYMLQKDIFKDSLIDIMTYSSEDTGELGQDDNLFLIREITNPEIINNSNEK